MIKHIYTKGEVFRETTVANFTAVQSAGDRQVGRDSNTSCRTGIFRYYKRGGEKLECREEDSLSGKQIYDI